MCLHLSLSLKQIKGTTSVLSELFAGYSVVFSTQLTIECSLLLLRYLRGYHSLQKCEKLVRSRIWGHIQVSAEFCCVCFPACVRACVRAFVRVCERSCVRACVRASVRVSVCVSVCVSACVFVRASPFSCVRACVRAMCVCMWVWVCVRACVLYSPTQFIRVWSCFVVVVVVVVVLQHCKRIPFLLTLTLDTSASSFFTVFNKLISTFSWKTPL